MGRPQHLSVPNTPEGIRRINELQRHYDDDPAKYEAEEQARMVEQEQEELERSRYEAEMQAQAEAEAQYYEEQGQY